MIERQYLKEDLAVWFGTKKKPKGSNQPKGPWVDICRKNEDGKHPPCGRPDSDKGAYPKCRAAGVAGKMSDEEKRKACRQKRDVENSDTRKNKGQKPNRVSHKNESLKDIITRVLREEITKNKVICDNCDWSWKLSEGGHDPYICHKCGHDNMD